MNKIKIKNRNKEWWRCIREGTEDVTNFTMDLFELRGHLQVGSHGCGRLSLTLKIPAKRKGILTRNPKLLLLLLMREEALVIVVVNWEERNWKCRRMCLKIGLRDSERKRKRKNNTTEEDSTTQTQRNAEVGHVLWRERFLVTSLFFLFFFVKNFFTI